MSKTDTLGNFEQLVLTAVMALGEDAYGVAVHERVSELAEKRMNLGSVYVTLERLENKGYVSSRLTEPLPERGGQPKRYYRLKADGARVLQESVDTSKRVIASFSESWRLGKWKPRRLK